MSYSKKRTWFKKHINDPYVKRSQQEGFRSRAAYKLLALQEKDNVLQPGATVIDLGAAPGAWSQVAKKIVGVHGNVIAVDLLPIENLPGVTCLQGDILDADCLANLYRTMTTQKADVVLSDIAPNLSGVTSIDQPRSRVLITAALEMAQYLLKPGGHFLVKCFHGKGFDGFFKELRCNFARVSTRKPSASRATSSEIYLVAKEYQKAR